MACGDAWSLGFLVRTGSGAEVRLLQKDGNCQNLRLGPVIHTHCETERQVQYTPWAALVQLEGWSCMSRSLSCCTAEALGGSSQVKQTVFELHVSSVSFSPPRG